MSVLGGDDQLVAMSDIARRLGVRPNTVNMWRYRSDLSTNKSTMRFPEPDRTVGGRPAWKWGQVVAWLRATGRESMLGES